MSIPIDLIDEEFNDQLAQAIENCVRDTRMAYPNLVDIPKAPKVDELQAQCIAEFNRKAKENKRHLENQVV